MRLVPALLIAAACGPDSMASLEQPPAEPLDSSNDGLAIAGNSHVIYRVTSDFVSRDTLVSVLDSLQNNQNDLDAFATAPNGSWAAVSGGARWYSGSFPSATRTAIESYIAGRHKFVAIDFNSAGGWVVVTTTAQTYGGAVPQSLKDKIAEYRTNGWALEDVDVTTDGYVVVGSGGTVSYSLPGAHPAEAVLYDRHASKRKVRQVDLGLDGSWVVVSDQETAAGGIPDRLRGRLRTMARERRFISRVYTGRGDNYVVASHGTASPTSSSVAEAIEYDVGGKTLWQAMTDAKVPGLSIAIIENNQVTSVRGYGLRKAGEEDPVLATTPYDLASLTKYVASLTTLTQVDEGKVSLNGDILTSPGPLISAWRALGQNPGIASGYGMPGTALPAGITPARLMRHRAGMDPQGGSPDAHPNNWGEFSSNSRTLNQMFGWDCGSLFGCSYGDATWAWVTSAPNGPSTYSNQNYLVLMAIAEDASGKRAVELMEQKLFSPMGLTNTSARVPLAASFEARTAWQHDTDGDPRSYRTLYPFIWAGGLHASAGDYAELVILALNQGTDSKGVSRISPSSINAMLNGVDRNAGFGMFFEGGNSALEGTDRSFNHNGSHTDRARTWMCGNPTRGEGIVVLTNRGTDAAVDSVIKGIMTRYTAKRGWPTNCQ
ncbi:MAG: beta-lactamase family protein [Myxococcaceae bacterium]|nr:beta-lactamase family protein [Myxococcaceae bacterium]